MEMKKSKQPNESDPEDGVDMISSLPDPILHMILSGLPTTEEVFRTSILSTRWKYLWTLIPSIDIDCSRGLEFKRNKFKNFVDHVLANSSLDLDSFRLCCSDHYNMSTVQRWINVVVRRNIKQLHLLFCCGDKFKYIELPNCVVTCNSLEVLRLFLYERKLMLPKLTGFSALKVLELNNVNLSNKAKLVKAFLKSCPLLEDLSLIDCVINFLKELCISCPKLKNLKLDNRNISDDEESYDIDTLCGCIQIECPKLVFFEFGCFKADSYIFKSLDSLKKAVIHPEEFPPAFGDYCTFGGIYYVESLSTSIDIFCYQLCPSVNPPSLPNLKTLKLTTGTDENIMEDTKMITNLIKFLKCLPHLESLHLIIEESFFRWEDWKLDDAETRGILTRHLKKVEFLNFDEEKLIVDIARSLLEHVTSLEEMVFRWDCDESEFHERSMETIKEVSNFQKTSSTVKLITLNEISYYQLSGKPGKP